MEVVDGQGSLLTNLGWPLGIPELVFAHRARFEMVSGSLKVRLGFFLCSSKTASVYFSTVKTEVSEQARL